VEFFWYAGEESGLLGSAEIAQSYKAENKDVVAVLQLDMTLFPGAGEFVVGNVSDFTSAWLRQYLVALNDAYLQVQLIEDKCGYACSDHASWYRQGYPTLMPFESDTSRMNRKIHTDQDVISPQSSFRHSLVFAKIALAMVMDLGNSTERQP
jgi:leucyl aminopeptidase